MSQDRIRWCQALTKLSPLFNDIHHPSRSTIAISLASWSFLNQSTDHKREVRAHTGFSCGECFTDRASSTSHALNLRNAFDHFHQLTYAEALQTRRNLYHMFTSKLSSLMHLDCKMEAARRSYCYRLLWIHMRLLIPGIDDVTE